MRVKETRRNPLKYDSQATSFLTIEARGIATPYGRPGRQFTFRFQHNRHVPGQQRRVLL